MNRFDKLVTNDTGYSSKSFTLVVSAILVVLIVVNVLGILWYDLTVKGAKIESDMYALGGLVSAVSAVLGYLYYQKVRSERSQNNV